MIIVSDITRNAKNEDLSSKNVDFFDIEWFETTRKVLRRETQKNQEVALRILKENFRIKHYDVLWEEGDNVVLANVLPADAVIVQPKTMLEMGTVCYEIGNQHIPIFIENDEVVIPYEDPIYNLLNKSGYTPVKGKRVFENMLKATPDHAVSPQDHKINVDKLFDKVLPKK